MPLYETLPTPRNVSWGTLRNVLHYRAMKAIHECDPKQLNAMIEEWRVEYKGEAFHAYLTYYRGWHYLIEPTEESWDALLGALTAFEMSGEKDSVDDHRVRCVYATMLWCAALKGDVLLAEAFGGKAVGRGAPRETVELAMMLAARSLDECKKMLPYAIEAIRYFENDEFYVEFLELLFAESSIDSFNMVSASASC